MLHYATVQQFTQPLSTSTQRGVRNSITFHLTWICSSDTFLFNKLNNGSPCRNRQGTSSWLDRRQWSDGMLQDVEEKGGNSILRSINWCQLHNLLVRWNWYGVGGQMGDGRQNFRCQQKPNTMILWPIQRTHLTQIKCFDSDSGTEETVPGFHESRGLPHQST